MDTQPKRVIGKPFEPGNPGRPKGARSKLGEKFAAAMLRDFEEHGEPTIALARMEDPLGYLKVITSIMPKELTGEDGAPLMSGLTISFVKPEKK